MAATARECKALSKASQPCQAPALPGSDYCLHHDPARELQRRAARIKGGQARHGRKLGPIGVVSSDGAAPVRVASIADVVSLLEREINEALQLERSLNRARTIGYLAAVAAKALEVSELERQIAEMRAMMNERHGYESGKNAA